MTIFTIATPESQLLSRLGLQAGFQVAGVLEPSFLGRTPVGIFRCACASRLQWDRCMFSSGMMSAMRAESLHAAVARCLN
jgi:hypothetical protein